MLDEALAWLVFPPPPLHLLTSSPSSNLQKNFQGISCASSISHEDGKIFGYSRPLAKRIKT